MPKYIILYRFAAGGFDFTQACYMEGLFLLNEAVYF